MYTLYDYLPSGNGYKVRLTAKHLAVAYDYIGVDITRGGSRTPEFLAKSPNGQIPLLQADDRFLAESHAIISFLANGSDLIPADTWQRALMWQWMCFEQYNLEPNIGTARFWLTSLRKSAQALGSSLTEKVAKGHAALGVLERGLKDDRFLLGDRFSLADIALYAYTHVAPEAGVPLDDYPHIRGWLQRVAAQPRHAPITEP